MTSTDKPVIKLTFPELDKCKIIGHTAALRPFRNGLEKFELEQYKNKSIYYNYGHGQYGGNLGYGSALKQFNNFQTDLKNCTVKFNNTTNKENNKVAVIGAGFVGIYTAYILRKNGFQVTIYSDMFPTLDFPKHEQNKFQKFPRIASQVAVGHIFKPVDDWFFKLTRFCPQDLKNSHDFYQELYNQKKFKGLNYRDYYDFRKPNQLKKITGMDNQIKEVQIDFKTGVFVDAVQTQGLVLDTKFLVDFFEKEIVSAGVQTIQKHFKDKDSLCENLEENVIFACTGIGSSQLFDDKNVYPAKGQLIYVEKPPGFDYSILSGDGDQFFYIHTQDDKMCLGGIIDYNNWDDLPSKDMLDEILKRYNKFKTSILAQKPKL